MKNKSEKALKDFLKELNKNGFTNSIKKHLNITWQKNEIFKIFVKKLKGIEFKAEKKIIFKERKDRKMYVFLANVNGEDTHFFVQPLSDSEQPFDHGHYGIIPIKLEKFAKDRQTPEEIKENLKDLLIPKLSKEEIDKGEVYIQYLKDGGKADDFEDYLKDLKNSVSGHLEDIDKIIEKTTPFSESDKKLIYKGKQPTGEKE